MRNSLRLDAALLLVVLLPSPAVAMNSADVFCRDTIARSMSGYETMVAKVIAICHQRHSTGQRSLDVDCNDVHQADATGLLERQRTAARSSIRNACSNSPALLNQYPSCPAPASAADDGGATPGIDDFNEVGDCLVALADARSGSLGAAAEGSPPDRLLDPLRKCQGKLAKGVARIVGTIAHEDRRCQRTKDSVGTDPAYACDGADPRGLVAKSRSRFVSRMPAACPFSPSVIAKLHACANDISALVACADANAATQGAALIRDVYEFDSSSSTTTTTLPSITTTTLPASACGGTFPQCNGSCPTGSSCVVNGSSCSCVGGGSGPCAPATIRRIIHSKFSPSSKTSLSTGWSGSAHDVDIPDGTGDAIDVTCDSNCENCAISMDVQAGNPASNCRCTSNPQTTCTSINGSDAAACGSIDPTCRCYFGAPLPLSSAGTPACVVNRIRQDYDGTMNLRSGDWFDHIKLASVVYLGLSQTAPCPTCNGDPVPNDGVRGGTCSGGVSSGACDANGVHATFGATSLDCLPTSAANISGTGLLIDLHDSTGSQSLPAALPCDTPSNALCPCRVCSGNGNLGCASDADCAAAGAGTCTDGGGAGVRLNECDNFQCGSDGTCSSGPVDMYCDGDLYPDGRGFIPCTSNTDCSASSAGACTVADLRRCFPDPINAVGSPDRYEPTTSSLFCIAPTSNVAVNLAAGLPGPGRLAISFHADVRCQSDPSLVYEFPSGVNCGGGGATTTTTLLPLPTCTEAVAPVCGGTCPNGQACTASGATCACTGIPVPSCADATAPVCGGLCPTTGDVCSSNGGVCQCMTPTLPQCFNATSPVCGGACPAGEICTDVGGGCACGAPGAPSCGSALAPACAGVCDVGSACISSGAGCACTALPLPTCAEATTPACAGTCSLGSACVASGSACQCSTLPIPAVP